MFLSLGPISPTIQGGKKITCINNEINHSNLISYLIKNIENHFKENRVSKKLIVYSDNIISFTADQNINIQHLIPKSTIKITTIKTEYVTEYLYQIYLNNPSKIIEKLNKELIFNMGKYYDSYTRQKNGDIVMIVHENQIEKIKKEINNRGALSLQLYGIILNHSADSKIFEDIMIYNSDDSFNVVMTLAPDAIEKIGLALKEYGKIQGQIIVDEKNVGQTIFDRGFQKQVFIKSFKDQIEAINFIHLLKNGPLPNITIKKIEDFPGYKKRTLILLILQLLMLLGSIGLSIYLKKKRDIIILILSFIGFYYVGFQKSGEWSLLLISGGIMHNGIFIISSILNQFKTLGGPVFIFFNIITLILCNFFIKNSFALGLSQLVSYEILAGVSLLVFYFIVYFSLKEKK
jgi:hypothetical protein